MPFVVEHSYPFKPGLWEVTGDYYDRRNNLFTQEGQLLVTHQPELWIIEGRLTIKAAERQEVDFRYEITPFALKASFTEWKSQAGGPEAIYGLFVLVGDTVMMPWQSKSGLYWGQEVLFWVTPSEYRGRGFAFLDRERVSAWNTTLKYAG